MEKLQIFFLLDFGFKLQIYHSLKHNSKIKSYQILLVDEKFEVFICILDYIHILTKCW